MLSLNQPQALADLLWLKNVQYFGQGNPYGKYPSLGKLLDTITTLDPKFSYPYEFGLIVLPFMDQTDSAIALGERAQRELPGNGLLTYYLATVYHLTVKDYGKAGALYQKASTETGAPGASRELAGVALSSQDDSLAERQAALVFWKTVYENARDEGERERAARWFAHMQLVIDIESAAIDYKKVTGRYPVSIDELVRYGSLPGTPTSPIGRMLHLSPETGKVDYGDAR
jgi:tetratricopeptide (TPR) repeat protein